MIETTHNKTIEVCKRILEKQNLCNEEIRGSNSSSECVVICKRSENGLFDIRNGIAKILENDNTQGSQFIVSESIKVMFIIE